MPAMNCAKPPNMAAKGASASGECGVPHQPARFDATMKVAPANPASPRIDGAAIGCRTTCVPNPFVDSLTPGEAVALLSSSVLILASLQRTTIYLLVGARAFGVGNRRDPRFLCGSAYGRQGRMRAATRSLPSCAAARRAARRG